MFCLVARTYTAAYTLRTGVTLPSTLLHEKVLVLDTNKTSCQFVKKKSIGTALPLLLALCVLQLVVTPDLVTATPCGCNCVNATHQSVWAMPGGGGPRLLNFLVINLVLTVKHCIQTHLASHRALGIPASSWHGLYFLLLSVFMVYTHVHWSFWYIFGGVQNKRWWVEGKKTKLIIQNTVGGAK